MSGILATQVKFLKNPHDKKIPYVLAYQYLQGLRENADTEFYDRTEKLLQFLEKQGVQSPEHNFLRGLILLGKHRFAESIAIAERLIAEYPSVHRYYGLMVDSQIELGKYDEAIKTLQTMADQNPDESTLTRIAYIREIYGDLDGAKEAMQSVIDRGGSGEAMAWNFAELARLYLPSNPTKADSLYDQALGAYPNFPAALIGKAKVAIALQKPAEALSLANKAFEKLPLPDYAALIGDIHAAQGDTAKARAQFTLVTIGYEEIERSGTIVDLERNRFLTDHGLDLENALMSARAVYAARPTIYAADSLAWALFKNGLTKESWQYSQKSLKTGTEDPLILFHSGMIAKANNTNTEAKKYLTKVQKDSPYFSFLHTKELQEALRSLR